MSQAGIDAARILRELSPDVAEVLAAELRNAAMPAACAAQDDDFAHMLGHAVDTVAHVLAIADALSPRVDPEADRSRRCLDAVAPDGRRWCTIIPRGGR
jgi:hypothetical protein